MALLSVKSIQGKRDYMEDRYTYIVKNDITIALVCDGHGGYQVADITCKELPNLLINALHTTTGTNVNHAEVIRNVIIKWCDDILLKKSGSTLTGVIVKNDIIYIINIGDSRTCIQLHQGSFVYMLKPMFNYIGDIIHNRIIEYKQTEFFCTTDHDSNSNEETMRVEMAGGKIIDERLNGILSVTRAIGDIDVGPGISCVPDVFWVKKSSIKGPAVLYSDGVYEPRRYALKNATVNFNDDYLYHLASTTSADVLVDYAFNNESDDNLTAMVVRL